MFTIIKGNIGAAFTSNEQSRIFSLWPTKGHRLHLDVAALFYAMACARNMCNVLDGRVAHLRQDPTENYTNLLQIAMQQQQSELPALQESRIRFTLRAIERDATLSQRRAAAIYDVPRRTLSDRRAGKTFRRDCTPNSRKLSKTEGKVIVQYILDLDARGFPPRLAAVKDMADLLLAERHHDLVGQNWAKTFVKRRLELKVKFNRKYDYKRALRGS
jgi:hypothetical protein